MKAILSITASLLLGLVVPVSAATPDRPNILLIVADDLGWADVGWHGGKFQTPNLDRLVKGGWNWIAIMCNPCVRRPALRCSLDDGPDNKGPQALAPTNLRVFAAGTVTLATALKECGYATFLSGKWHLGSLPEWGPQHYGFDHSYGSLAGAVDPWAHTYRKGKYLKTWHRDGELQDEEGNATELVARQAGKWIREGAGSNTPWFIYVPFQAVHNPIDAPEEYKRLYADVSFPGDEARTDAFRRYGAFVSQMDAKVGELVKALENTDQRSRTLVTFTSDNGGTPNLANPYAGNTPPMRAVVPSNLPLRGNKNQLYEGGFRVSAFVTGPECSPPQSHRAYARRRLDADAHAASRLEGERSRPFRWARCVADPDWSGEESRGPDDLRPTPIRRGRASRRVEADRVQTEEGT